jgi:hypothetical protein
VTHSASAAPVHPSTAAFPVVFVPVSVLVCALGFVVCSSLVSWSQMAPSTALLPSHQGPIVIKESKHDTGPLLREIAPRFPEFGAPSEHEIENNVNPNHNWSSQVQKDLDSQVERKQTPPKRAAAWVGTLLGQTPEFRAGRL